ncbi:hypothetical protein EK21DRAFT_105869 [Setomelanomma holmii]|uniref:Uncharacterized protein n=1 Tax=Setomelanomma holmii TaxID=210430 RepID=A0A9P4HLK2_9PLEO|nr:hypothetical protein EK21DRAFT_105869 [Setomelanomma holmii]
MEVLPIVFLLVVVVNLVSGNIVPRPRSLSTNLSQNDNDFNEILFRGPEVAGGALLGRSNLPIVARDDPEDRDPSTPWSRAVCKGERLLAAMQYDHDKLAKSGVVVPVESPWDGELRQEMRDWGYKDFTEADNDLLDFGCQFDNWGFTAAFQALGISSKSSGEGVMHLDGPAVIRKQDNSLPPPVTGADFKLGMNAPSGAIFSLDLKSPSEEAKTLWGVSRVASADELPAIRYVSDITWALWNRHVNKEHGNINNVRYIFAINIANPDTEMIMEKALTKYTPGKDNGEGL